MCSNNYILPTLLAIIQLKGAQEPDTDFLVTVGYKKHLLDRRSVH